MTNESLAPPHTFDNLMYISSIISYVTLVGIQTEFIKFALVEYLGYIKLGHIWKIMVLQKSLAIFQHKYQSPPLTISKYKLCEYHTAKKAKQRHSKFPYFGDYVFVGCAMKTLVTALTFRFQNQTTNQALWFQNICNSTKECKLARDGLKMFHKNFP